MRVIVRCAVTVVIGLSISPLTLAAQTRTEQPSGEQSQMLSLDPRVAAFDKCCTNCGEGAGSACNTCQAPNEPNRFNSGKWCFPGAIKANCDSEGNDCKRAELSAVGGLRSN